MVLQPRFCTDFPGNGHPVRSPNSPIGSARELQALPELFPIGIGVRCWRKLLKHRPHSGCSISAQRYTAVPASQETGASVSPDDMHEIIVGRDRGEVVAVPIIAALLDTGPRRRRPVAHLKRFAELAA